MYSRGVFKTQSNIYDEAFLRKWLTAEICQLFPQKSSVVDVRQGSNLSFVNSLMSAGKKDYTHLKKPASSIYDLLLPPCVKGLKLLFTFMSCLP